MFLISSGCCHFLLRLTNQKIFVPFSTPSMLLCVIRFLVPARAYLGLWPLNSFPFAFKTFLCKITKICVNVIFRLLGFLCIAFIKYMTDAAPQASLPQHLGSLEKKIIFVLGFRRI